MNKVILMGRLSRDPESNNGAVKTSLAVSRFKEGTDFLNLVAFGKTGETFLTYLKKGSQILVEGRIQTGSYTNKEGRKVTTTDIIVDHFEFCGSKEKKEEDFITVDADNDEGVPFFA